MLASAISEVEVRAVLARCTLSILVAGSSGSWPEFAGVAPQCPTGSPLLRRGGQHPDAHLGERRRTAQSLSGQRRRHASLVQLRAHSSQPQVAAGRSWFPCVKQSEEEENLEACCIFLLVVGLCALLPCCYSCALLS